MAVVNHDNDTSVMTTEPPKSEQQGADGRPKDLDSDDIGSKGEVDVQECDENETNPINLAEKPAFVERAIMAKSEEAPTEEPVCLVKCRDGEHRPVGVPDNIFRPQGYESLDEMWLLQPAGLPLGQIAGPDRDPDRFGHLPFKVNDVVSLINSNDKGLVVSKRWSATLKQYCYKIQWEKRKGRAVVYLSCRYPENNLQLYIENNDENARVLVDSMFKDGNFTTNRRRRNTNIFTENGWSESDCAKIVKNHVILYNSRPCKVLSNDDFHKAFRVLPCNESLEPMIDDNGVPVTEILVYYEKIDKWDDNYDYYFHRHWQLLNQHGANYEVPPIGDKPPPSKEGTVDPGVAPEILPKVVSKKAPNKVAIDGTKRARSNSGASASSETSTCKRTKVPLNDGDDRSDERVNAVALMVKENQEFIAKHDKKFTDIAHDFVNEIWKLSTVSEKLGEHTCSTTYRKGNGQDGNNDHIPQDNPLFGRQEQSSPSIEGDSQQKTSSHEQVHTEKPKFTGQSLKNALFPFMPPPGESSANPEISTSSMSTVQERLMKAKLLASYQAILKPKSRNKACKKSFLFDSDPVYCEPKFIQYFNEFCSRSQCLSELNVAENELKKLAGHMWHSNVDLDKYFEELPVGVQADDIKQRFDELLEIELYDLTQSSKKKKVYSDDEIERSGDDSPGSGEERSGSGTTGETTDSKKKRTESSDGDDSTDSGLLDDEDSDETTKGACAATESKKKQRNRKLKASDAKPCFGESTLREFLEKKRRGRYSTWEHMDKAKVTAMVDKKLRAERDKKFKGDRLKAMNFLVGKLVLHIWSSNLPDGYVKSLEDSYSPSDLRTSFRRALISMRAAEENWEAQKAASGVVRWVYAIIEVLDNSGLHRPSGRKDLISIIEHAKNALTKERNNNNAKSPKGAASGSKVGQPPVSSPPESDGPSSSNKKKKQTSSLGDLK